MTLDLARGQWQAAGGLVHEYVAYKTAAGRYHVGTLCLTYEDMYMHQLPTCELPVTCLACLVDPKGLRK